MRPLAPTLLALTLGCGSPPTPEPLSPPTSAPLRPPHHYTLELVGDTADLALWLPPGDESVRLDLPDLAGRAARRGQLANVRCEGRGTVYATDEGWLASGDCRVLRWTVRFEEAPEAGTDPAALRAVRNTERGWWLLPGAAAFLVPEGSRERGTLDVRAEGIDVFHRLPPADRVGVRLPAPPRLGRVFLGFGHWIERTRNDGATTWRHLFDREPEGMDLDTFGRLHAQASAYLSRVTGRRLGDAVDVFWLGRDPGERPVSGAAGVDAILATHVAGELAEDAPPHARHASLLVLLHEQFHLLEGSTLPAWASESLAHHYALAALVHVGALSPSEAEDMSSGPEPGDGTLLDAQRAYEGGDMRAYARFYTDGARFWRELDTAIRDASEGARGLDDVLRDVLGLVFVGGGAPPRRFLEILREVGLEAPEAITRRHLGWPARE